MDERTCCGHEAMAVRDLLMKKDMHSVRERLAGLVGRDTDQMDEEEAVRAGIETISENLVDGVISPLFFCSPRRRSACHGLQGC